MPEESEKNNTDNSGSGNGIPIPENIFETFENFENAEAGNHIDQEHHDKTAALQGIEKSLNWLANRLNDQAAKKDTRLALDKSEIPQLVKLCVVVAERNVPANILKNSPEIMLSIAVGGIIAEKSIVWKQIQKENSQPKKTVDK